MREKPLYKKDYWVLVVWHVWLVWILPTKCKSLKRVENFEIYVIFFCYYLFILLIKLFLFCCVHLLFRLIHQTVLLSRYLSFSICSALNPDCSFVFEWRNLLGIWYDAQIFVSAECTFASIQFLFTEGMSILFGLHWAVMVKIISSYLCSPVVVWSAMRQDMSHFTLLLWLTRR